MSPASWERKGVLFQWVTCTGFWGNITTISVCLGNTASKGIHYTVTEHSLVCFYHTEVMSSAPSATWYLQRKGGLYPFTSQFERELVREQWMTVHLSLSARSWGQLGPWGLGQLETRRGEMSQLLAEVICGASTRSKLLQQCGDRYRARVWCCNISNTIFHLSHGAPCPLRLSGHASPASWPSCLVWTRQWTCSHVREHYLSQAVQDAWAAGPFFLPHLYTRKLYPSHFEWQHQAWHAEKQVIGTFLLVWVTPLICHQLSANARQIVHAVTYFTLVCALGRWI